MPNKFKIKLDKFLIILMTISREYFPGESPEEMENLKLDQARRLYDSLRNWSLQPEIFMTRSERNRAEEITKKINRGQGLTPEEENLFNQYQSYQKNKLRKQWFTIITGQIKTMADLPGFITDKNLRDELRQESERLRLAVEQKLKDFAEKKIPADERNLNPEWVEWGDHLLEKTLDAVVNNLSENKKREFNQWAEEQKEVKK